MTCQVLHSLVISAFQTNGHNEDGSVSVQFFLLPTVTLMVIHKEIGRGAQKEIPRLIEFWAPP